LASLPNTEQEARFKQQNFGLAFEASRFYRIGSHRSPGQSPAFPLHPAFGDPRIFSARQRADESAPAVESGPEAAGGVAQSDATKRLALAGAQVTLAAWKRGEVPDPDNDGILMAQEVGLLDLQNTWLVTLSACDPGIGEARTGEGVMGLPEQLW
jgi:hypothetical protein